MNIFILDNDPVKAAQQQCDKHVVKMIVESAQMLSTAHRMLDGHVELRPSKSGKRMVKHYILNDKRDDILYKAVHYNHPCTVWTMESHENYLQNYSDDKKNIDEANDFDDVLRIYLGEEKTNVVLNNFYPYILLKTMLGNKLTPPKNIEISIAIPRITYPNFIKITINLKTS